MSEQRETCQERYYCRLVSFHRSGHCDFECPTAGCTWPMGHLSSPHGEQPRNLAAALLASLAASGSSPGPQR